MPVSARSGKKISGKKGSKLNQLNKKSRVNGKQASRSSALPPGGKKGNTEEVDPAYSLYSTDSEDPVVATNKDLDRCAQLLKDILGSDQDDQNRGSKKRSIAQLSKFPSDNSRKGTLFNSRLVSSTPQSNYNTNNSGKTVKPRTRSRSESVKTRLKMGADKLRPAPQQRPTVSTDKLRAADQQRAAVRNGSQLIDDKEQTDMYPVKGSPSRDRAGLRVRFHDGSHGVRGRTSLENGKKTTPVTQIELDDRKDNLQQSPTLGDRSFRRNLFSSGNANVGKSNSAEHETREYRGVSPTAAWNDHIANQSYNAQYPKSELPHDHSFPPRHQFNLSHIDGEFDKGDPSFIPVENSPSRKMTYSSNNFHPSFIGRDGRLDLSKSLEVLEDLHMSPYASDSNSTITGSQVSGVERIEDGDAGIPECDKEPSKVSPPIIGPGTAVRLPAADDLMRMQHNLELALQPLRSENSQLRRRVRILNQQLRQMEHATETEKSRADVNFELVHLQTANTALKKEISDHILTIRKKEVDIRTLEEENKALRTENDKVLAILSDKDKHHLKSIQEWTSDTRRVQEQLTIERASMKSLETRLESLQGENHVLQLAVNQRDSEIKKLKEQLEEEFKRGRSNNLRAWLASSLDGRLTKDSLQRHHQVYPAVPKAKPTQPKASRPIEANKLMENKNVNSVSKPVDVDLKDKWTKSLSGNQVGLVEKVTTMNRLEDLSETPAKAGLPPWEPVRNAWSSSAKKDALPPAEQKQSEAFQFSELDTCLSSIDDSQSETGKSVSSMATTVMDRVFQDGLAELDQNIMKLQRSLRETYGSLGASV